MNVISIFNNKGGVGKSTLAYHLASALSEMGHKTLMIDLDPQSNLTLYAFSPEELEKLWTEEEEFISDFSSAKDLNPDALNIIEKATRSIHFILKPIEDGVYEYKTSFTPKKINENLGIIPGRLSLQAFEEKIAKSWSDAFLGDPQAVRMISAFRDICKEANQKYGYTHIIIDTSPSLGMINRIAISTSNGFFVPCTPDMFSLFGISNIGKALELWKKQFTLLTSLLPSNKKNSLPEHFVKFLGYTLYNAKKYKGQNKYDLATAHFDYAEKIPKTITTKISKDLYESISDAVIRKPIGGTSIIHTHNTFPSLAQKYRRPMWEVPSVVSKHNEDYSTVNANRKIFTDTQKAYRKFATNLLARF